MAENANTNLETATNPPVKAGDATAGTEGLPAKTTGQAGSDASTTAVTTAQAGSDLQGQTWGDKSSFRSALTVNPNGFYDLSNLRIEVNQAMWSDVAFRKQLQSGVDDVFKGTYGNDHTTIDNSELKALRQEREKALAEHHKPGDQWIDHGVRYRLTDKGALVEMTAKGDDLYVSPDGNIYQEKHDPKDPKNYTETWFKPDGQAIRHVMEHDASGQPQEKYEYVKSNGRWDEINDKGVVQHFGNFVVDLKEHAHSKLTLQVVAGEKEGFGNLDGSVLATLVDKQGNKLFKISSQSGAFAYDHATGKVYHLLNGKAQEFDLDRIAPKGEEIRELPAWLKRDLNGDLLFGSTTRLSAKENRLTDSERHIIFDDKALQVQGILKGHTVILSVHDGVIKSEEVGVGTTTNDTRSHHIESRDAANKVLYSSDFSKEHGLSFKTDVVDFSRDGTHIHDGYANFTVRNLANGAVKLDFADGSDSWTSGASWQLQVTDATNSGAAALAQATAVSLAVCSKFGSGGVEPSDIGALESVIGQLNAAQAACLRCGADQFAVSLSLVAGRLEGIKNEATLRLNQPVQPTQQFAANGGNPLQSGPAGQSNLVF